MASSGRIQEVLEEEPAQKMADEPITPDWKGEVTFEDVSFSYVGSGNEALSHVSFGVHPGETIGIIGSTGSGKSTLVNLVPRFYDATRRKVCIDGMDVKQMDEKELRRAIAVVPQKALLF